MPLPAWMSHYRLPLTDHPETPDGSKVAVHVPGFLDEIAEVDR